MLKPLPDFQEEAWVITPLTPDQLYIAFCYSPDTGVLLYIKIL
jgi:hypothetical protein